MPKEIEPEGEITKSEALPTDEEEHDDGTLTEDNE